MGYGSILLSELLTIQIINIRRLLFEEDNQNTGDCGLTGRFASIQSSHKPPSIAVNNHQEEKQ